MSESKKAARHRVRERLSQMSETDRQDQSRRISAHLAELPELRDSSVLIAFWPTAQEPDLRTFLQANRQSGRQILLPRVTRFKRVSIPQGRIVFAPFEEESELVVNRWGIAEPAGAAVPLPHRAPVLVPALAVSPEGARLGHGMGFYDEILSRNPGLLPIAVVFRQQLEAELPLEAHDVPIRTIITPDGVIRTGPDA